MDLHGRFRHSELAANHLVGVAETKAGENGVLPLGKLGSRPNAVGSMAEPEAGRLAIEKGGGLPFVSAVVRPNGRRLIVSLSARERLLLEEAMLPAFGREPPPNAWLAMMAVGEK